MICFFVYWDFHFLRRIQWLISFFLSLRIFFNRWNRKREAEKARYASSGPPSATFPPPASAAASPPPPVPAYQGSHQPIPAPSVPPPRVPGSYSGLNSPNTTGSSWVNEALRDRERGIKKEESLQKPPERRPERVPPPAPLNLAAVSRPKREPVEDEKMFSASQPTSAQSQPTPQPQNIATSPTTAPLSAAPTSSRGFSGPSTNVGGTPPTGPRAGVSGPRRQVEREVKESERSWPPSQDRAASVESTLSTGGTVPLTPQQPNKVSSRESLRDAPREVIPPRSEFGGIHPDRMKEIETAAKVAEEKDIPIQPYEQPIVNRDASGFPPLPAPQRGSSVVSSRPGSSSSTQGFRGQSVGPSFPPSARWGSCGCRWPEFP